MPEWSEYVPPSLFAALLLTAAFSDAIRRRIPNWAVLALVGLYVVIAVLSMAPTTPWQALAAALIAFPVTYGLYHFGVLGAGDAKLFTAAALFVGLKWLLAFAVITAMFGGVLAIGYLIVRPRLMMRGFATAGRPEGAAAGLPYGVPIALGAAAACYLNGFLSVTA